MLCVGHDLVEAHLVYLGDSEFSPALGLILSDETLGKIEQRSGFVDLSVVDTQTARDNNDELRKVADLLAFPQNGPQ
jgi:hypothetical protein